MWIDKTDDTNRRKKDQEYTMAFSNTLNHVRRIKSGKENMNVSLSYARHLFSMVFE
jgi:hypothetical protein